MIKTNMSHDKNVWVRWGDLITERIAHLDEDATANDLCEAFVNANDTRKQSLDPADLEVYAVNDDDDDNDRDRDRMVKLEEDERIWDYFIMSNSGADHACPGPGQTKTAQTALSLWVKFKFPLTLKRTLALMHPPTPTTHDPRSRPPSNGRTRPKQIMPNRRPSSKDGKAEGLRHVSDDCLTCMQATSHPACMDLLRLYEDTRHANDNDSSGGDRDGNRNETPFAESSTWRILRVRDALQSGRLSQDIIGSNEEYFNVAMAIAMNALLRDGYVVEHQACIGHGNIHSDVSACRIEGESWPRTLMVGEGRWNADYGTTRSQKVEVRGQIINELMRHRKIENENNTTRPSYRPILLLAFDEDCIEIDLTFPSTKGGKLESDGFVRFSDEIDKDTETFWTVPLLRIPICGSAAEGNLRHLFRFLPKALDYLFHYPQDSRVQVKMPMPLKVGDEDPVVDSTMYNDNVTMVDFKSGAKRVYKEYCYHLREYETQTETQTGMLGQYQLMRKKDHQRQPPSKELLDKLGHPYKDWKVEHGPLGTSVLHYDFIEGSSNQPTVEGWLMILNQVKIMHENDYVHGDLQPHNVLFTSDDEGYVIDFDLSRKVGERYVSGFNYYDFMEFRHQDARRREKMEIEHDLHALRQMSRYFFDLDSLDIHMMDDDCTLDRLISLFRGDIQSSLSCRHK